MGWSLFAGTSRLHEAPPRPGGLRDESGPGIARRARAWAWVSGLASAWGLGGLLAHALLSAWVALPVFALSLSLGFLRRSRVLLTLGGIAGTAAAAFALAPLPLFPGGWLGWALPAFVLLAASLVAGLRIVALERAFDASGRRASWRATAGLVLAWRSLPFALARGLSLGGIALLDVLGTLGLPRDRVHADADLDALAVALTQAGATSEPIARGLLVRLDAASPSLKLRVRRLPFPFLAHASHLEIRADATQARKLRNLLEGPCCHALVFAWSDTGTRLERRLNAMLREAAAAQTLEERSLLMEEANRLAHVLAERDLNAEEHAILATLKGQRIRGILAMRMLSEPPGSRVEGRLLAPAAAMVPPLGRVLDAGGLSAVRRLVYVPHWVVPVATAWGESEVLVNAATGKADPEGDALLAAMRRRAPAHFLDAGSQAQFLPAPAPTAALLREMRGRGALDSAPAALELLYVPFVGAPEGYLNAVTGGAAPDLGPVLAPPAA